MSIQSSVSSNITGRAGRHHPTDEVQTVAEAIYINSPLVVLVVVVVVVVEVEVEVDVVVFLSSRQIPTDKTTMKMKAAAKETKIRSVVMVESYQSVKVSNSDWEQTTCVYTIYVVALSTFSI